MKAHNQLPHLVALSLISAAKIMPSETIMLRKAEMIRRGKTLPTECPSCHRKGIETFPYSQTGASCCADCIPLKQSYGMKGPGTGRFCDKTQTTILADRDRVLIATTVDRDNIPLGPDSNFETITPKEMSAVLMETMANPPDEYVVVPFAASSPMATDLILNIDPNRMHFSGKGRWNGIGEGFRSNMVIGLSERLAGVSGDDFMRYVLGHKGAAAERVLAAQPGIRNLNLDPMMPEVRMVRNILNEAQNV